MYVPICRLHIFNLLCTVQCDVCKVRKLRKFTHTPCQTFRESNVINFLLRVDLTKKLRWDESTAMCKFENFSPRHFCKKFVKVTFHWRVKLNCKLISRTFFEVGVTHTALWKLQNRWAVCAQCGKMKNLLSQKNISSNYRFSKYISKTVVSTKFC